MENIPITSECKEGHFIILSLVKLGPILNISIANLFLEISGEKNPYGTLSYCLINRRNISTIPPFRELYTTFGSKIQSFKSDPTNPIIGLDSLST